MDFYYQSLQFSKRIDYNRLKTDYNVTIFRNNKNRYNRLYLSTCRNNLLTHGFLKHGFNICRYVKFSSTDYNQFSKRIDYNRLQTDYNVTIFRNNKNRYNRLYLSTCRNNLLTHGF